MPAALLRPQSIITDAHPSHIGAAALFPISGYQKDGKGYDSMRYDENEALPPGIIRARDTGTGDKTDRPRPGGSVPPADAAPVPLAAGNGNAAATGRITAIEPQARRQGRVNVFVDGAFALGLFEEVSHALGLHVGQPITAARLEEIARAETLRRAREDAYRLLSFRGRSEKEIEDRLRRKGYEEDVIAAVTDFLRDHGYLDDTTFARSWVQARGGTRGRRALAHELRQKGVSAEVSAETLGEIKTDEAELEAARSAAVKKAGARPADQSREARARLAGFLQRRGFGWDVIRPVLAELYAAAAQEEEEAQEIGE